MMKLTGSKMLARHTALVTALIIALAVFASGTLHASARAELQALKEEVQALRQGQEQMAQDLAEIRKLLEQRPAAAPAPQGFQPADFVVGNSPALGEADAPVTLVEFSDYQCPFCKRHATNVMPDLVKQYIDSGKVRIVMREMPIENIHPRALAASNAALCAREQGQYWAMHDLLFANQQNLQPADLKAHAVTLALDTNAFDSCLDENRFADEIRAGQAEGQKLGISGTPSFVAGLTDPDNPDKVRLTQFIRGAQPLANFQQVLDGLLKEAGGKD